MFELSTFIMLTFIFWEQGAEMGCLLSVRDFIPIDTRCKALLAS